MTVTARATTSGSSGSCGCARSADVDERQRLVGNGRLYTVDNIQFSGAPKGGRRSARP